MKLSIKSFRILTLRTKSSAKSKCVIAPTLFVIFCSMMLRQAFQRSEGGIFFTLKCNNNLFNIACVQAKKKMPNVLILRCFKLIMLRWLLTAMTMVTTARQRLRWRLRKIQFYDQPEKEMCNWSASTLGFLLETSHFMLTTASSTLGLPRTVKSMDFYSNSYSQIICCSEFEIFIFNF